MLLLSVVICSRRSPRKRQTSWSWTAHAMYYVRRLPLGLHGVKSDIWISRSFDVGYINNRMVIRPCEYLRLVHLVNLSIINLSLSALSPKRLRKSSVKHKTSLSFNND